MIEKIEIVDQTILIKPNRNVYFPKEDTFLLIKNLKNMWGDVLEVGVGSGIVSIYLAKKFSKITKIFATDKSTEALKNALFNVKINKVKNKIKIFYSDLFKKIPKKKFDFIIFNSPYLPTTKKEKIKGCLNLAFDGGEDGLKTIKKFLEQARNFLKEDGIIYLVISDLIDMKKIKQILKINKYKAKEIAKESFFFERIILYKIKKNKN